MRVTASDAASADDFGYSVAIEDDTVVVGSVLDDNAGGVNAGAAYVYFRSGTAWSEQAKLVASDAVVNDRAGYAVAISGDTAVVGAILADLPGAADAGVAYVYVRSGAVWSEQAKLTASDAANSDTFGIFVSLAPDLAVIGAHQDDLPGAPNGACGPVTCAVAAVDVSDNVPPVITSCCTGEVTVPIASDSCLGALPDFTGETVAGDNCGAFTLSQFPPPPARSSVPAPRPSPSSASATRPPMPARTAMPRPRTSPRPPWSSATTAASPASPSRPKRATGSPWAPTSSPSTSTTRAATSRPAR